jgi:hypothetical protein
MSVITRPAPVSSDPGPGEQRSRRWPVVLLVVALLAGIGVVAYFSRSGPVAERIENPAVAGNPRPVEPLFGFDHWITVHQIGTVLMMIALVTAFVIGWRRHPRHPILLMTLAVTLLAWMDPIANWAPYAVYNPDLRHWPESWGLVSMSPTVEPFIVVGYATFYMLPFFPAVWILRRIQARRSVDSFVWRHPLLTLAGLMFVIGFVFDAMLEIFLVRTQLYIYSQVVPFGSIAVGETHQFPLIWESTLVLTVMIPAGILLYRDDTGKTQAEKLAQRARFLRNRPALATFLVMFLVVNAAYLFLYIGGYSLIRATGTATSVACPWPYPEAKVYDPQGYYEAAGQPGPYSPGIWSDVLTAHPDPVPSSVANDRCI